MKNLRESVLICGRNCRVRGLRYGVGWQVGEVAKEFAIIRVICGRKRRMLLQIIPVHQKLLNAWLPQGISPSQAVHLALIKQCVISYSFVRSYLLALQGKIRLLLATHRCLFCSML